METLSVCYKREGSRDGVYLYKMRDIVGKWGTGL